mgnify:CR=1 FL=1
MHGTQVIVDVAFFDENLPHSVAAIISDRDVHRQFIDHYDVDPNDYPLVAFTGNGFVQLD